MVAINEASPISSCKVAKGSEASDVQRMTRDASDFISIYEE